MNKSQRFKISTGDTTSDKYFQIRLEQNTETLEFLTLSLDTKDVYNSFNSDYGVLIGRVVANGGIGIPNAKISVFIPISDDDLSNPDISSIYPYTTPRDKNKDGKRYNLLPRVSTIDPETGTIVPKQAFGSFPLKHEFVTNSTYLEVYKKYYKYSTVTNDAGDYMIFGVPTGTQTIHMSCDITDIGKYSMNPAAMVTNLGYSPNLFTDNNTRIKPSNDLDDLPNIETQEIAVDIIPFWGDSENFIIGITRQDFRIRAELVNTFVIFGSAFTDGDNSMWGDDFDSGRHARELWRARAPGNGTIGIGTKRIGRVTEKIYYYPANITDEDIDSGNVDPVTDMKILDPSQYSTYKRDGDFVFIVNCNRRKVVTDEFGNEVVVANDNNTGAFTRFRGFMTLEITEDEVPMDFSGDIGNNTKLNPFRYRVKIPQKAKGGSSFNESDDRNTDSWRKQHFEFSGGSYYSVAKFHGIVFNNNDTDSNFFSSQINASDFFKKDVVNTPYNMDPYWNTGIINTNNVDASIDNESEEFPSNSNGSSGFKFFGANWLNFSIHLPQVGYLTGNNEAVNDLTTNTNFTSNMKSEFYLKNNTQDIAGGDFNTVHFARSDLHFTDFIRTPVGDIVKILNSDLGKGFKSQGLEIDLEGVEKGYYKYGGNPVPIKNEGGRFGGGGRIDGDPNKDIDPSYYFYRGLKEADCLDYLRILGLVTI